MRTTRTKRKKRKRTGSSPARIPLVAAAILILLAPVLLLAAGGKKNDKQPASYALVAGTVFRNTGFSLPGAEIELSASDVTKGSKFKKVKVLTDNRGEFAIRVPPLEASYTLAVKAAGYLGQEKPVAVHGEERVDVFFQLEPASKQ